MTPTRVAILGGGPAGIATAFHLSAPELEGRFEVTVHTMGWRLGGKCASGRDAYGRVQEHGLHVWFGFYDNCFGLMDAAWRELGHDPEAMRASTFERCESLVLYEPDGPLFSPREFALNEQLDDDYDLFDVIAQIMTWLRGLRDFVSDVDWVDDDERVRASSIADIEALETDDDDVTHGRLTSVADRLARDREIGFDERLELAFSRLVARLFARSDDEDDVRFIAESWDLGTAIVKGLLVEGVVPRGPFDALNDRDLRAWLAEHGARETTLANSSILRAFYDLVFGYVDGDKSRGDVAAGKALQALIRIVFGYEESMLYKFTAGMGDAIFCPLYAALRQRGVRFEFFHRITEIEPHPSEPRVETVHYVQQIAAGEVPYDPLPTDGDGCWPCAPHWEQLGLQVEREYDYERSEPGEAIRGVLRFGEDFDAVVAAIPITPLAAICERLAERDAPLRRMFEHADTVATQALQLWFGPALGDLGWPHALRSLAGAFREPFDTYSGMDQILAGEGHGPGGPAQHLAYLCAVLDDRQVGSQEEADELVFRNALEFLERIAHELWPECKPFDWEILVAAPGTTGPDRLREQYWRANIHGSERYTTTRSGTVHHRLAAHESGFANLALAGDWTRNGLNGGSVEAAITSGLQAARWLRGEDPEATPGMSGWLERDGFRRAAD